MKKDYGWLAFLMIISLIIAIVIVFSLPLAIAETLALFLPGLAALVFLILYYVGIPLLGFIIWFIRKLDKMFD
jgi:hypothetical protein